MILKRRLFGFLGVLLLLVSLGSNVGPVLAAEKVVNYVEIGPLTGPGAGAVLPLMWGVTDYCAEVNLRGGVDGVKIKHMPIDDKYDVARGLSIYQRYRKMPQSYIYFPHKTGLAKSLLPLMEQDRHVQFTSGAGFAQGKIGRTFLLMGVYQDFFGAALDWMVSDWQKKGKSGKPVVGYLSWEGAYGLEALNGGAEYAKKLGIKLLPPEFFPTGSIKHDTWLQRLAKDGANYIYVGGVDPTQTNVIRDAHALGLTEKIQMVSSEWGLISTVGVRAHPTELEGSVVVTPVIRGEESLKHPMGKIWTKYRKQPLEEMNPFYLTGMANAMVVEAALKIALREVGYEKNNGDVMIKALEQLGNKDMTQGIFGLCDYSSKSRLGSRQVRLYRIQGGNQVSITNWITAPDCISLGKF